MPPDTLAAFLDHGTVARTIDDPNQDANIELAQLAQQGINLLKTGEQLQREGVDKFIKSFDTLLDTLATAARDHVISPQEG